MRAWVTSMTTSNLYEYISSEAERITGPYIKKVRAAGKLADPKKRV